MLQYHAPKFKTRDTKTNSATYVVDIDILKLVKPRQSNITKEEEKEINSLQRDKTPTNFTIRQRQKNSHYGHRSIQTTDGKLARYQRQVLQDPTDYKKMTLKTLLKPLLESKKKKLRRKHWWRYSNHNRVQQNIVARTQINFHNISKTLP